jgi:VanZ family protein
MTAGLARASSASAEGSRQALRLLYAFGAVGFVLFAIWGSLFPFHFEPASLDAVAARFSSDWVAAWSLTDLLSNVLLFVPIGLLLTATMADGRAPRIGAAAAAAFAASVALSATIEVVQAFVPSRTPSIIDIAAEACGALAGAALWRWLGAEIDALSTAAVGMVRRSTRTERALLLYCLVFAVAWLLPADFTLRPAEIGDKYVHQRLLLPFTPSPDAATRTALGVTVAAAVPLGIAAMLCGGAPGTRRTVAGGMAIAAVSLVVLEVGQIAVFSRTTDGASLLAALAGAIAGAVAAARYSTRIGVPPRRSIGELVIPVVAWFALAVFVEWWPFDVALSAARAGAQMTAWSRAPFRSPSGLSDIIPGTVLALVAGWWLRRDRPAPFARLYSVLVLALAAMTFLVFETGRVLLSSGRPTLLAVAIKTMALAVALHGQALLTPAIPARRRTP